MTGKTASDGAISRQERAERGVSYVELAADAEKYVDLAASARDLIIAVACAVGASSPSTDPDVASVPSHDPVQSHRERMQDFEDAYANQESQRARRVIEQAERDMELEANVKRQGDCEPVVR